MDLIVFGAGGHGNVVADAAIHEGWTLAGFVDDRIPASTTTARSTRFLGDRAWLHCLPRSICRVVVAVGDNYARKAIASFLSSEGIELATVTSPLAFVSSSARIGAGSVIMPGAVVNAMAVVGEGVIINTGAVVEHDVEVGDYAHVSSNATLGGGSQVGEMTLVGMGAIVLPLICIGSRSILGAGSVVTRIIPDDVTAFGVPARVPRKHTSKRTHSFG
jgi:sugar O-acyltransferase (sialic acid O-acetyltransferase NeuD family)